MDRSLEQPRAPGRRPHESLFSCNTNPKDLSLVVKILLDLLLLYFDLMLTATSGLSWSRNVSVCM